MVFDQSEFDLRCEWGLTGLRALAPASDVVIVVDVLSFSTAVDIVVANGASVLPHPWNDESAARFAREKGALLASARRSETAYSLSPQSLRNIPEGTALALPSPNGSTLCRHTSGKPTFTACLRNAPAVAAQVARTARRIVLIPAGERWRDDTLRPCVEDLAGAGAVLALLPGKRSPEAEIAVPAFESLRGDLIGSLSTCASGKELAGRGFTCDVALAAQYGVSPAVPMLNGDRFVDARAGFSPSSATRRPGPV